MLSGSDVGSVMSAINSKSKSGDYALVNYGVIGKIGTVLGENGKVDPAKLNALIFDQFQHGYYVSGEQAGKAWNEAIKQLW